MASHFYLPSAALFLLFSAYAHADVGPYYIQEPDYCVKYELYLTPENYIYGIEYGCSVEVYEGEAVTFVGFLMEDRSSFFLVEANPQETSDEIGPHDMLILEYSWYSMTVIGYQTDGYYFAPYLDGQVWDWFFSDYP